MTDSRADVTVTVGGQGVPWLHAPVLSLIVVNRDYGRFLGQTIDSIKAQDYAPIECVIVDNGSTDQSLEVIERHVAGDPRFSVVALPENRGQLGGLLAGLDKTSGQFLAVVDADDVLMPSFASVHVQTHLAVSTTVAVTSSELVQVDSEGRCVASSYRDQRSPDGARIGARTAVRAARDVVRLSTVTAEYYEETLSPRVRLEPATNPRWLWSPGTNNVLRRSVVDLVLHEASAPRNRSADSFLLPLCHAFGGTALVDLPLASYRVHGANYFARRETLAGLRNGSPDYFNSHRGDAYDNVEHVLAGAETFRWVLGGTRFWEVVDQVSCREGWLADFYSQREAVDVFVRTARATCAAVGEAAFVAAVCGRFRPTAAREIVDAAFDGRPSARVELLLRGLGWRRHWAQRHEVRRVVDGARWALRGGRTR